MNNKFPIPIILAIILTMIVLIAPANATLSIQLAATDIGEIWNSTDTGQTWTVAQQLGAPGDETVYALADLGGGVILAGTSNISSGSAVGEIWRSTDYGTTFSLDQQILTEEYVTHLTALDNNIALAGTANGTNSSAGIYRSSDNGITWDVNQEFPGAAGAMPSWKIESSVSNLGGGIALASGGFDFLARVYRSTDYGQTWTNITSITLGIPGTNSSYVDSFADLGGGVVLAGMYTIFNNADGGIHRSDDYGQTWTHMQFLGDPMSPFPAVTSLGNNTALTATSYSVNGSTEIYRSLNDGQDWDLAQALSGEYSGFNQIYSFTNISDGTAIAGRANTTGGTPTAGEIWRTTDYGTSWALAQTLGSSTAVYDTINVRDTIPPVVNFISNVTSGDAPLTVQFNDTSLYPTSWLWDFGGDGTSTDQNATHVFTTPNIYYINLSACNGIGCSFENKTEYITVSNPAPVVGIPSVSPQNWTNTTTSVTFTDSSSGTNITGWAWQWLPENNASTSQNPSRTFPCDGTGTGSCIFDMNHSAVDSDGTPWNVTTWRNMTNWITIYANSSPTIWATSDVESGVVPLTVHLTATEYGPIKVDSWNWTLGDGVVLTYSQLPNPSQPTNIDGVTFSSDTVYLAEVGADPKIGIYKRSGDTFNFLTGQPNVLPSAGGHGIALTSDGTYLAVAHAGTGFLNIYKRSGDTFTYLSGQPDIPPTGEGAAAAFTDDGVYLAIAHVNSPYVTIYKRSGDTFTKLADPATLPSGGGTGVSFTPDGEYLAVAFGSFPRLYIYKRSGDTFTKLDGPDDYPSSYANGVAFSRDKTYLAVGYNANPYIYIYKRSGDTFTKLANPGTLPTAQVYALSFSQDSLYLAVGSQNSPYLLIYKRSGDTFTKLADPTTLPPDRRLSISLTPDATYLAAGGYAAQTLMIYKNDAYNYTTAGQYTVTLTGTNYTLGQSQVVRDKLILVSNPKPTAAFTGSPLFGNTTSTIHFTDASTGTNVTGWSWDFGDTGTSALQNPDHVYSGASADTTYSVTLTATDSAGTPWANSSVPLTKTDYITIYKNDTPAVSFTGTPLSGERPLAVQFNATPAGTIGVDSWAWDFGDGNTSSVQNASNIFILAGQYQVNLTATNYTLGQTVVSKTDYIAVTQIETGSIEWIVNGTVENLTYQDYGWITTNVTAPKIVIISPSSVEKLNTTVTASGNETIWLNEAGEWWGYLYNNTMGLLDSTSINIAELPETSSIDWIANGTVKNETYQDFNWITGNLTASPIIRITDPTSIEKFNATVAMSGTSTIWIDKIGIWNVYLYNASMNLLSSDSLDIPPPPTVNFSAYPTDGMYFIDVVFTDLSQGYGITDYYWDFGDGDNSTAKDPTHEYTSSGPFTVRHSATNISGTSWKNVTDMIRVWIPPYADFTAVPTSGYRPLQVQFNDTSIIYNISATYWDFGEGNTSTDLNPVHTYDLIGTFTVSHSVTSLENSTDWENKTGYITVNEPSPPIELGNIDWVANGTVGILSYQDYGWITGNVTNPVIRIVDPTSVERRNSTVATSGNSTIWIDMAGTWNAYLYNQTMYLLDSSSFFVPSNLETGTITWTVGDSAKNNTYQDYTWSSTNVSSTRIRITNPLGTEKRNVTGGVSGSGGIAIDKHGTWYAYLYNSSMGLLSSDALSITEYFTFNSTWDNSSGYAGFGQGIHYTDTTSYADECRIGFYNPVDALVHYDVVSCMGSGTDSYTPTSAGTWKTRFYAYYTDPGIWYYGVFSNITINSYTPTGSVSWNNATVTEGTTEGYSWSGSGSPSYRIAIKNSSSVEVYNQSVGASGSGSYLLNDIGTWNIYFLGVAIPPNLVLLGSDSIVVTPIPTPTPTTPTPTPTTPPPYPTYPTMPPLPTPTPMIGTIPEFDTDPVSNITDTCVIFNANVSGPDPGPVWFGFSSNTGGNYAFRTNNLTVVGGQVSARYCGFPLLPNHQYYYALENDTGYGSEVSFVMPGITPHPTTNFGAPVEEFLTSELNVTAMASAIWAPYMQVSGVLGMGLIVGGIFFNMALKQQSVRIPAIILLLTGGVFWTFMPPEFIAIAQIMIILSLSGMVFWFFQQRR